MAVLVFPAYAGDYYIAQTAAGSGNGSSEANADAIADLTWGNGNMVDAGDTLHLCGTITSTLTIGADGTSENPITIIFETGAKFSKAYWGSTTSAAIVNSGHDYIVINGGTTGIIESTDNGTALTNQQAVTGIYMIGTTGCEIKNLTLQNLYVRTPDSDDSHQNSMGIYGSNNNSLSIHDNTIEDVRYGICCAASSGGNKSGLDIYNNDLSRMSTGIVVRLDGAVDYANVDIYGNTIYDFYVWDGEWNGGTTWNHNDGIHTWGNYSGNTLGPLNIYNNKIGGDFGEHTTSWIYLTDYTLPVTIYNNIFYGTAEGPAGGYVGYHNYGASGELEFYNNVIDGPSSGNTGGMGLYMTGQTCAASIKNNVFKDLYIGIYDRYGSDGSTLDTDYNDFYNVGTVGRDADGWYTSLNDWKTNVSDEANSITDNPDLNANYKPDEGDDPVVNAGVALNGTFTTDKDGTTRGTTWDMGAYEFSEGGFALAPVAPRNLRID